MALINDTDLLLLEPTLFTDASTAAVLLEAADDATLSGSVLISSTAEFNTVGVNAGHVVVVNGEPLEITGAIGNTTLSVTKRRSPGSSIIKPGSGSGLTYEVLTFSPTIDASERWLDRVLGLDANHPTQPLTSANVQNYEEFASLVALHCIASAFSQVSAATPEDDSLRERAELYERLDFEMRQHLVASVDVNGNGVVDERRRLAVGTWVRL